MLVAVLIRRGCLGLAGEMHLWTLFSPAVATFLFQIRVLIRKASVSLYSSGHQSLAGDFVTCLRRDAQRN